MREPRPNRRTWVLIVFVAVATVAALHPLATTLLRGRLAAERQAWAATLAGPEGVLGRYPARAHANDAALAAERAAAACGIRLSPRSVLEERALPEREAAKAWDRAAAPVGRYVEAQLERADSGLAPPPERVHAYLDRFRQPLQALRETLLSGEAPLWERDLSRPFTGPLPNLLGQLHVHRVFTAAALADAAAGRSHEAERWLEASWRLNDSLRDEPFLIEQLLALVPDRFAIGLLRHLPAAAPIWKERLSRQDYRARVLQALRFEAWSFADEHLLYDQAKSGSIVGPIATRVLEPYLRMCQLDTTRRWRRLLDELGHTSRRCGDWTDAPSDLRWQPAAWWNHLGEAYFDNLLASLDRADRAALDAELTALWLGIQQSGESVATEIASNACPETSWQVSRSGDGTLAIALDPPIAWHDLLGLRLPQRFETALPFGRPRAAASPMGSAAVRPHAGPAL